MKFSIFLFLSFIGCIVCQRVGPGYAVYDEDLALSDEEKNLFSHISKGMVLFYWFLHVFHFESFEF